MANGLNQLGVLVRKDNDTLIVSGTGGRLFAPRFPIPVDNAGTTLRFLLSLASLADGRTVFESDLRMSSRPIDDLLDALEQLGVEAQAHGTRFSVSGAALEGGRGILKAGRSSQFLSSLLMVAPQARSDVRIEVEGRLTSLPYVDMTIEVMRAFGSEVESSDKKLFLVKSGRRYRPTAFRVEPDASGASYFFAAAAITGGEVMVRGLSRRSSQGDVGFVEVLERMGCEVREASVGLGVRGSGELHGIDIDMNSMPDVVPTLAVTALFANGPTRIRNVAHLRHKESDRLTALATELKKVGAGVSLSNNGIDITPVSIHGAQLDTYDDHRLAMSFALVGLRVPGVRIENPECVKKSFPKFWEEFEKMYTG
jgi:3-phosphoshikimate 1-carboxyvinyltransferase